MPIELSPLFKSTWKNKDPFEAIEHLQGDVFRELEARKTLRFHFADQSFFIKIHYGVGWFEIIENLLRLRKPVLGARNEYLAIKRLEQLSIDTMKIVGFGERGINPATQQSFIITEDLVNTISLEDYASQWTTIAPKLSIKRTLIILLADISRTLHQNGINHRDYYICHFLMDISMGIDNLSAKNIKLFLIDLHRAQLRDNTPVRWAVKDIGSLYYSVMELGLNQRDLYRFMKRYHQCSLRDCMTQQGDFWQKVEQQANKLWHRKQRKGDAL